MAQGEEKERKKRLDYYLLWQEGFRNWRGHENKRKSIGEDRRVAFESRLWRTVSKCMETRMESWSVRRSKYLLSLPSSLTWGREGREWTISNNVSRTIRYRRSRSLSIRWREISIFFFLFFYFFFFSLPPPRISRPNSLMFSIKGRFLYFFPPPPLPRSRSNPFRHQPSFEAPLSVAPLVDKNVFGLRREIFFLLERTTS